MDSEKPFSEMTREELIEYLSKHFSVKIVRQDRRTGQETPMVDDGEFNSFWQEVADGILRTRHGVEGKVQ